MREFFINKKRGNLTFLFLLAFCISANAEKKNVSYTIDRDITTYVGKTITLHPWSDASETGYTCVSTSCRPEDPIAFSITKGTKTETTYYDYNRQRSKGYYYNYYAKALIPGNYIINCPVNMVKHEGINYYDGFAIVAYHITVKEQPVVISITIPTQLTLKVGDTYTFTPAINEPDATTTLSWSSSNSTVVSVKDGTIKALKPGLSTITCIATNGVSASCEVEVSPIYIDGISLNTDEIELEEGERFQLVPTITPNNATNQNVIWKSTNEDVVFVSDNGIVIAIKEGYANILVQSTDGSEVSASCLVHVKRPTILVQSISLSATNCTRGESPQNAYLD